MIRPQIPVDSIRRPVTDDQPRDHLTQARCGQDDAQEVGA